MKYIQKHHLAIGLILVCFNVHAQDRIYFTKNKTDNWKVTEITKGSIKGTDEINPQTLHSTTQSNVLFLFNSMGNFLVIPGLYDNVIKADVYIRNFFLQSEPAFGKMDKLITVKNDIITGIFRLEKGDAIEYTVGNKFMSIPKKDLAVVIFKDGKHKLFTNADKALKTLKSIQDDYYELAFSTKKNEGAIVNRDTQAGSQVAQDIKDTVSSPIANQTNPAGKDSSFSKPATKQLPVAGNGASIPEIGTSTGYSATRKASLPGAKENVKKSTASEIRLDSNTITSLQKKALTNIKELEGYIRLISDKNTDPDQVAKSIDQALSLFINEDATVEVSSVKRSDVQQYKIGVYLKRLGLLKYDKVIIEWYDVQYTSRLRKGADGNYYGFIEFEQRFTGIMGDNKTYEDVTRKTVEVVLKTYEKRRGGESAQEWDVYLGNIGIAVTKPS